MRLYRVRIKGNLLGDCYLPASGRRGTVILLPGLPSYLHKSEFARRLAASGYAVLQPFYYGSWVSGGRFSPRNCFKTVTDAVAAVRAGRVTDLYNRKTLPLPRGIVHLGGISFGTNVIQSMPTPEGVRKIFLVSAVPVFDKENCRRMGWDGKGFVGFLRRGFPRAYDAADWKEWERELSDGKRLGRFAFDASRAKIFQGEKDAISPAIVKGGLTRAGLRVPMKLMRGAGHALDEYDQPKLASAVRAWLSK